MRICVDMDEVLYDFEGASRFLIEERWGVTIPSPSSHWTYAREWLKENTGSEKAWHWLWKGGVDKGLFRHGHVLRGAFRAMHEMHKAGHELVVITSRPQRAAADTLEWLGYHRMPVTEVHILGPGKRKIDVLPWADLYIDDAPHHIEDVISLTTKVGVLFDRPWNQDFSCPKLGLDRFYRAHSWEEVHQAIEETAKRS